MKKTLQSPLDFKEIQPVHPMEISSGCSLEGLMLRLKLQYFGYLMRRVDSLEKTLMLGGIGARRRRGRQRMRWLDGITDSMDMSLSELQKMVIQGRTPHLIGPHVNTTQLKVENSTWKILYSYWRILVLQSCDGLCHISVPISHNYIYIPPPSRASFPPSTLPGQHQAGFPRLYSSFLLHRRF